MALPPMPSNPTPDPDIGTPPPAAPKKSLVLTQDQLAVLGPVEPGATITLVAGELSEGGQNFEVVASPDEGTGPAEEEIDTFEEPGEESDTFEEPDPAMEKVLGYAPGRTKKKPTPKLTAKDLEY